MGLWCRVFALILASVLHGCGRDAGAPPPIDLNLPSSHAPARMAIVFLHGVLGDAITTFGTSAQANWPRLLADDPKIGPLADIISIGYASGPISKASNINEIATRVLLRLRDKQVFASHDKVIFIVHSMGGLVTKRFLTQLRADHPTEYAKVVGVFFLATPAGGSDVAGMVAWIIGNPQFRDMAPLDMNTLLQQMEDDWQAQLRIRTVANPFPRAYCVYETLPTGSVRVVPRSTAQMGCDERPAAFDKTHVDLVKPLSRQDEVYEYVAARIERIEHGDDVPLVLSASLLTGKGEPLPKDAVLRTGQQFAMQIETNRPSWFYVISQDSTGRIRGAFPSDSTGSQTAAVKALRVPQDQAIMLQLDKERGVEHIYVLASTTRSAKLESLYTGISNIPVNETASALKIALETRGLVAAKTREAATPKVAPPRFDTASAGAEAVGEFVIEHR